MPPWIRKLDRLNLLQDPVVGATFADPRFRQVHAESSTASKQRCDATIFLSPFEAAEAGHHRFLQTGSRPVSFKPTLSGPGSVECLCHLALLQFWDVKHVKICESLQSQVPQNRSSEEN